MAAMCSTTSDWHATAVGAKDRFTFQATMKQFEESLATTESALKEAQAEGKALARQVLEVEKGMHAATEDIQAGLQNCDWPQILPIEVGGLKRATEMRGTLRPASYCQLARGCVPKVVRTAAPAESPLVLFRRYNTSSAALQEAKRECKC